MRNAKPIEIQNTEVISHFMKRELNHDIEKR